MDDFAARCALITISKRDAANQAPSANPVNRQGALPLCSCFEDEHIGHLPVHKVECLAEFEHHYNGKKEEWLGKYKRH